MTIFEFLTAPEMVPFTGALLFVLALLMLEVLSLLIGGSLLGQGGDADTDVDLAGTELDTDGDIGASGGATDSAAAHGFAGFLAWLGIGKVPLILWLAGMLTVFGIVGYGLQLIIEKATGGMLSPWLAAAIAFLPSLVAGSRLARMVGRIVPSISTEAVSRNRLGSRHGVIVVGTARRGHPAQARVADAFGNNHYIRVEPEGRTGELRQGEEIVVLRRRNGVYGAIRLAKNEELNKGRD